MIFPCPYYKFAAYNSHYEFLALRGSSRKWCVFRLQVINLSLERTMYRRQHNEQHQQQQQRYYLLDTRLSIVSFQIFEYSTYPLLINFLFLIVFTM